jgi:uncharacterized protein
MSPQVGPPGKSKRGPVLGGIAMEMIYLLRGLFRKDLRLFGLIEGSAQEAHLAIEGLAAMLKAPAGQDSRDALVVEQVREARKRQKALAEDLRDYLSRTMLTPLEREDIEALSNALYKIPKTATKLGYHYLIAGQRTADVDLSKHIGLLSRAVAMVRAMVSELRRGANVEQVRSQNEELGQIEGEADKLMLVALHELYTGGRDAIQVLLLKDLLELLDKVHDRCREAGGVVFQIALKQS